MIVGICGTYDDTFSGGIRGNGKTCTMTAYLHSDKNVDNRRVYTNYHTTFSEVMETKEIMNLMLEGELFNSTIGIDEIQRFLTSLGTKAKIIKFFDDVISQIRKYDIDFYYTSQRFLNVNNRLRTQTEIWILPEKRHLDGSLCCVDRCSKEHIIYVYSKMPFRKDPITKLNPAIVGKYYNTREQITEEFNV